MSSNTLLQLFPPCSEKHVSAEGLYLTHRLDKQGTATQPFVYSNYVVSLDGRIALEYPHSGHLSVPPAITSRIDWRLYQELAAQSDVLLTSGRYIRELAAGTAQSLPPVGKHFPDLIQWRRDHGLTPQPAIVILSRSLDLPLANVLPLLARKVFVATGVKADKQKLAAITQTDVAVLLTGDYDEVEGCQLIHELGRLGYRSIYAIAGPGLLDTLLRASMVDRLYLTQVHTLLGGQCYDTLLESAVLEPAAKFLLASLYYDRGDTGRQAQFFAIYNKEE